MSTETKSPPPRAATAILALAAPAYGLAQIFAIGAAATAGVAAFFIPRRGRAGRHRGGAPRAHRRGGSRTGRTPRLMT